MQKFFKGVVAGVTFLLLAGSAQAQNAVVQYKNSQTAPGSVAVTPSTPLPVTGTFSATSAATASATLPTLSAGTAALYQSLSGGLYSQLIFGTTIVDGSHGLPINIVAGGLTGSTSNATSGVATSSINTPTVAYNYGFNGTTWDQLQVDGSKNLKTVFSNTSIAATQSGTWTVQPGNTANTTAWLVTGTGQIRA